MNYSKHNPKFISQKLSFFIVFATVLLFALHSTVIYSVPAPNEFIEIKQPDNSPITIKIRGDEKVNWFENKEGYTLLRNDEGYIVYATLNENGDLVPSNNKYYSTTKNLGQFQNTELQNFLETTQKKLWYSNSQIETMLEVWNIKDNAINKLKNEFQNNVEISGTRKYLVILMSYPDRAFSKTREEFCDLFNKVNYQGPGGYGSVRDYFYKNSFGKFIPEFTVVGPFTARNEMAYYRRDQPHHWLFSRELAREAARAAHNSEEINFADFDNTGDGFVDAITVVFAGYGRESGDHNAIWSHAGYAYDNFTTSPQIFDGKTILRYCCFPELRGNSGNNISGIGVACHEFAHTLGSPDYYDTDYETGGQYAGAGTWCLMASGCWNGPNWMTRGTHPSNINIFQRSIFGWVTPEILGSEDKAVIMQNSAEHPVAYRINTSTNNEFFIMENRQKVGFDSFIPGSGLLIWRVHSQINTNVFEFNCNNCTHPQRLYPVCAAATVAIPNSDPNSYGDPQFFGSINSDGTPFPGRTNNRSFTDHSTPCARSWSGALTHRPITNITEENSLIKFNYTGRPSFVANIPYSYNFENAPHFDFYTRINAGSDGVRIWRRERENNVNWYAGVKGYKGLTTELNNAWLITPAFSMTPGMVYRLTINAKAKSSNSPEALAIYIGNSATIAGQTVKLLDLPEIINDTYQEYSVEFIVPTMGFYYIGLHCYSGAHKDELFINDIAINQFVGIEDRELVSSINIYPNPTDGKLIIDNSENISICRIDISDISGRILISTEEKNIHSIDLSSLNSGKYLIIFHTVNGIEIKSIIKQP